MEKKLPEITGLKEYQKKLGDRIKELQENKNQIVGGSRSELLKFKKSKTLQLIREIHDKEIQVRQAEAQKTEEFLSEYSNDLLKLDVLGAINSPDFDRNDQKIWLDNFGDLATHEGMRDDARWMDKLKDFLTGIYPKPKDWDVGVAEAVVGVGGLPNINDSWTVFSYPKEIEIKLFQNYYIRGLGFGDQPGKLEIQDVHTGEWIPVLVRGWGNHQIYFKIPEDTEGVPLSHTIDGETVPVYAKIFISIANSENRHRGLLTTLIPRGRVYVSKFEIPNKWVDSGWKLFSTYKDTKTFKSPPLPESWELFPYWSWMAVAGVVLVAESYQIDFISDYIDEPATFTVIGEAVVVDDHLEVTIKVEDDRTWDFDVEVQFLIIIPNGFATEDWC